VFSERTSISASTPKASAIRSIHSIERFRIPVSEPPDLRGCSRGAIRCPQDRAGRPLLTNVADG
jgi:hypothetical protein